MSQDWNNLIQAISIIILGVAVILINRINRITRREIADLRKADLEIMAAINDVVRTLGCITGKQEFMVAADDADNIVAAIRKNE